MAEDLSIYADPLAIGLSAAFNQARQDYSARDAAIRATEGHAQDIKAKLAATIRADMVQAERDQQEMQGRKDIAQIQANAAGARTEETSSAATERTLAGLGLGTYDEQGNFHVTPGKSAADVKKEIKAAPGTPRAGGGGGVPKPKAFTSADLNMISKYDEGDKTTSDDDKAARIMSLKPGVTVQQAKDALLFARSQAPYVVREGTGEGRDYNIRKGLETYRYLRKNKGMKSEEALFEAARDAGVTMQELAEKAGAVR